MIFLTNPKISGFAPQWAPFKGFSILFDNPGDSLLPFYTNENLKLLNCDPTSKELEFYKILNETLNQFPQMTNTFLFCPLPIESYHVTLWDGINDENVQSVFREYRFDAEDLLQDLTNSFFIKSRFLNINHEPLHIQMAEPVEFQFDKLIKWDNSVLAAQLKPANSDSKTNLHKIEKEREYLIKHFKQQFGLETCSLPYEPHVSLGYFANKELAELSTSMIEAWNEEFLIKASEASITFTANSLYGFTDMTTFFKK